MFLQFILCLVCIIILACILATYGSAKIGGAFRPKASEHIVVDTLNLAHWLGHSTVNRESILESIDRSAALLKRKFPGRVVFVLKDADTVFNDASARAAFQAAAERNRVHIICTERYRDPPARSSIARPEHAAKGRDDLFMCITAHRYRCAVATNDRFRDFSSFRAQIPPFQSIEFAFWRALPAHEYVRPDSMKFARLRPPRTIRFDELGI